MAEIRYIPPMNKSTTTKVEKEEKGTQIQNLKTVEECKDYYDRIQSNLENLRTAQIRYVEETLKIAPTMSVIEIKDKWCKHWATSIAKGDVDDAKCYEYDRWIVMRLLYRVCDLCYEKVGGGSGASYQGILTDENGLVNVFGKRRIVSILDVCLGMERANSLHNMMNMDTHIRGFHWYSQWHAEENLLKFTERNASGPTMNKRILWLYYTPQLELQYDISITHWLRPTITPLHFVGNEDEVVIKAGYKNEKEDGKAPTIANMPLVTK